MPDSDPKQPLSYLILGHVSIDRMPSGNQPGGTAVYAGLTAVAAGASVTLVTSCAEDTDLSGLRGMTIHRQPAPQTTVFENQNLPDGRRKQWIHSLAEPIRGESILLEIRSPDIVHLAPIAGETRPELFMLFPKSLRCITLQGLMRRREDDHSVSLRFGPDVDAAAAAADAAVFSLDDVARDEGEARRLAELSAVAAVTDGPRGCRIHAGRKHWRIPAPDVVETDPTGAGDIFAAVFFLVFRETGDPEQAARFAVKIASGSVTRAGLRGIPTAADLAGAMR